METDDFTTIIKALYVIFIITISVANLILIVKQVRKPLFYQNAKTMIIISLAIGDLLLALFPLAVMADIVYNRPTMDCSIKTISLTYMNFLINFVYGVGLVTLGAEVLLRHRINALHIHKGIIAFIASSIPWIFGLVIILPLCLAKVDFDNGCSNSQSKQSMLGVSILFPASLAVVVTAILNLVNFSNLEDDTSTNLTQSQFAYQRLNTPFPNTEQGNNQGNINGLELNPCPSIQTGVSHYPRNQLEVYPCSSNQPGVNDYHRNQSEVYPYPISQPGVNLYTRNQSEVYPYPINKPEVYPCNATQQQTINVIVGNNQTTNIVAMLTPKRKTEVRRLLVIANVFFCSVVPVVVFLLNVETLDWPNYTIIVVAQILAWLMVARSFITPLIMIKYSDL